MYNALQSPNMAPAGVEHGEVLADRPGHRHLHPLHYLPDPFGLEVILDIGGGAEGHVTATNQSDRSYILDYLNKSV